MRKGLRARIDALIATLARPRDPESLPLRLDRRRVYVLPTRFGLFFAALLLAMLLGALNYNNNPALLLALLLASAGLASLIAAHLQLSGLGVESLSAEPVAAGQTMRLQVALSTNDRRPRRGLQLRLDEAESPVSPFIGQAVASLSIATSRRGWLPLGRIRISTTQPLGLALAWAWVWPDAPLLVYPAPEMQGPPLPSGGDHRVARAESVGDEMHHLRDYRSGDPIRSIAWKPSARRDTLLVREYEPLRGDLVELDWRSLSGLDHERKIARLARWVELAERAQRPYRLRVPGQPPLGPAMGPAHRHMCLRALALLPEAGART